MKHARLSMVPSAETLTLSDEERAKRLRALTVRPRDAHELGWDTLVNTEQL